MENRVWLLLLVLFVATATAQLSIVKKTNGARIDREKIPRVRVGYPVTWTYEVTNTGKTFLNGVRVTDSRLASSAIRCPATPASLLPGASMTCTATGTAQKCGYTNQGCVTATNVPQVCAGGAYNGVKPSISIAKFTNFFTNQELKNTSSSVCIKRCDAVTWTYVVSNTGDELLTGVRIVDNQFPNNPPVCPITNLAPWWSITCRAFGQAQSGPYTNFATVFGSPAVGGPPVLAWDKNSFLGSDPRIKVTVKVNNVVTDTVGSTYSTPIKSQCDPPHYRDGEGEGEGEGKGKGKSGEGKKWHTHALGAEEEQEATVDRARHVESLAAELPEPHDNDETDAPARDAFQVLGEGKGEGNKKGNSGQKDGKKDGAGAPPQTYKDGAYVARNANVNIVIVIENVGTEAFNNVFVTLPDSDLANGGAVPYVPFTAANITCTGPTTSLPVGGRVTCTAPVFANSHEGKQWLNVAVSATAACSGGPEPATATGKWYTPIAVPVTPGGTKGSSSSGEGEGESHNRKATGCEATWWATAAPANYPSYWNPNTPFYKAAGLSKDPLSGQSLSAVLQATGDGLNAFYRAAAAALLNSATVSHFGLSKWEVQSRIESALSRYFRSGSSDTTSIDLWRRQFDGWARPCA